MMDFSDILRTWELVASALGWTLLHALWQCTAILLAWYALSRVLHPTTAAVRYVISVGALATMLVMIPTTLLFLIHRDSASRAASRIEAGFGLPWGGPGEPSDLGSRDRIAQLSATKSKVGAEGLAGWVASFRSVGQTLHVALSRAAPVLAILWFIGCLVRCLRLGFLVRRLDRLRTVGLEPVPAPLGQVLAAQCQRLAQALGIRRPVALFQSASIDSPVTLGWLRPIIVLPLSALATIPADDYEAILLHELAHIRRRDWLINLLQSVAESVLFFHPAAIWISQRIRIEREFCCDDMAASRLGDPLLYASALTRLEQSRRTPECQLALSAADGHLLTRIRRVLSAQAQPPHPPPHALAGAVLALGLVMVLTVGPAVADQQIAGPTTLDPVAFDPKFTTTPSGLTHPEPRVRALVSSVARATGTDIQYPLENSYDRVPLERVDSTAAEALEALGRAQGWTARRTPAGRLFFLPAPESLETVLNTETLMTDLHQRLERGELPDDGPAWNGAALDQANRRAKLFYPESSSQLEPALQLLRQTLPPTYLIRHLTLQSKSPSPGAPEQLTIELVGIVTNGQPGIHFRAIPRMIERQASQLANPISLAVIATALGQIQPQTGTLPAQSWPAIAFVISLPQLSQAPPVISP